MESSATFTKFRMPAEWAPHQCTWMLWPYRTDNWKLNAAPAQTAFVRVARAIAQFEPVQMGVLPDQLQKAEESFRALGPTKHSINLIPIQYDDVWVRDSGPTFVYAHESTSQTATLPHLVGMDWVFNAWGEKPESWDLDATVAKQILAIHSTPVYSTPGFVLEGGSIHVDGEGTLITTAECLLNRNRNPHMTQVEIEDTLKHHLGVSTIIWLPLGLAYDEDTDGHVDNFCCFARPGVALLCWTDDPEDPNYSRCRAAEEVLLSTPDAQGRKLEVVRVPLPPKMQYSEEDLISLTLPAVSADSPHYSRNMDQPLPGSYLNFYLVNGGLVMPSFDVDGGERDRLAREILQSVFPDREVVQVPGRDILVGGGNIHCITQQVPIPL